MRAYPLVASFLIASLPAQDIRFGHAQYERLSTAAFFYTPAADGPLVHGQIEVTYGSPKWKPEFGEALAAAKPGERLRLGNNFWSTCDVSCALALGGDGQLEPGFYYLALQKREDGGFGLVFLDPTSIREAKLNANQTAEVRGGVVVPLMKKRLDETAERMRIAFTPADETTAARLELRFGPWQMSAVLPMVTGG